MTPGDEYVDPLIRRGEELEAMARAGLDPTPAEIAEHASIKAYARARIKHLREFPLADTAQEESAQYRAEQEARSASEREAAFLKVLTAAGRVLGSVGLALLKAELTKATDSLDVPASLAPVLRAVEAAAMDAVGQAVADVTR